MSAHTLSTPAHRLSTLAILVLAAAGAFPLSAQLPPTRVQWSMVETDNFAVMTDGSPRRAETVASSLEALHSVLANIAARERKGPKTLVYAFERAKTFERYSPYEDAGSVAGFFTNSLVRNYISIDLSKDQRGNTVYHELLHEFAATNFPGVPLWFNEGLAEYLGNSTVNRKGEIEIGRAIKGRYVLDYHGGATRRLTNTGWTLDQTKDAIRKGEAPTLGELFLTPYPLFTGERGPLNYGTSWLFVHFLRHGDTSKRGSKGVDGDWAQNKFPAFLLYLIEGYPARDAIEQIYGMSLSEMNEQFRDYAKRF